MTAKSIYFTKDDEKVLRVAKNLSDQSLSSIMIRALREFIERETFRRDNFIEVVFKLGQNDSISEKRFWGRELLSWHGFDDDGACIDVIVYTTKRDQLAAITESVVLPNNRRKANHLPVRRRQLLVAKNIREFDDILPSELIGQITKMLENPINPVEYLDV